ncbi:Rab9 effector protein [Phytophthora cinnamomi]|uniref:Rab9 effector protein n=1 Tax=Phytophthora cinnamomi TaxID=4785 RepID=UPI003559A1FB|nr:Rab9 effector protein [Phytophthora cinnamomi]
MPLLSYEGVEVDLPTDLAGIHFEFTAGSLTIHCRNFTGDVVLSKPAGEASTRKQQKPQAVASPSKKRTIDLSASDDNEEEEADTKRLRPNFLNEAEQTLLLAQLDGPQNSNSGQKPKGKRKKTKAEPEANIVVTDVQSEQSADSASEATPTTGEKMGKKTPTKKSKKKATTAAKGAVNSFFSPEPKQSTLSNPTPDSNKKRMRTPKSRPEPSPAKSIKELMTGPPKPKPAAAAKWEMLEALGNIPSERWGHTATKISEERVVVYGGTDDEERTLGDLHVFDMKTHRWTTPLNCETITRTWHDAVYLASKNLVLVFGGERNAEVEGELDILSDIAVLDTECLLCRGRNRQSSVHILDTDDWNWKAAHPQGKPPSARTYHSAVAVGDNQIVYFGGNDSSKSFNAVHVLKKSEKKTGEATWSWFHPSVIGVPPQARTGHSATLLENRKVLIFGGWDPQRDDENASTTVFDDAFLLDIQAWEWQPVAFADEGVAAAAYRGRVGHGAVLDKSGRVHLFGGQNSAEQRLKDICTITISQTEEAQQNEPEGEVQAASTVAAASVLETNSS